MHILLGPRHFGDVDQALDARLQFDEGAVVGDVGDAALEAGADRIFGLDALPRVVEQLLHAERDAVGLVVDLDDLDLHLLADVEHLGGMIDASPGDIGDMQKSVDAAEIDEGAVIGDVLDHAVDDLTLFEVLYQLLRCSARVSPAPCGARPRCCRAGDPSSGSGTAADYSSAATRRESAGYRPASAAGTPRRHRDRR
jgi:hypothetical protein